MAEAEAEAVAEAEAEAKAEAQAEAEAVAQEAAQMAAQMAGVEAAVEAEAAALEAAEEAEVAELEAAVNAAWATAEVAVEFSVSEELDRWGGCITMAISIPVELDAASRKVQALQRGRLARKRVAEKRAAKKRALLPPPTPPPRPPTPEAVTWYYQTLEAAELEESVELQLEVQADGNVALTFWVLDDYDQAAIDAELQQAIAEEEAAWGDELSQLPPLPTSRAASRCSSRSSLRSRSRASSPDIRSRMSSPRKSSLLRGATPASRVPLPDLSAYATPSRFYE